MVPTQNPAAAPLAKQIIMGGLALAMFLPGSALAAECRRRLEIAGQGEREASRAGLQGRLTCDEWDARLSGHLASRNHAREIGHWSLRLDSPLSVITAGRQYLPSSSSFLAQSWSALDEPLREKGTLFAGVKAGWLWPGLFGMQGQKSPGAFLASRDFFAAFHPETGLGALAFRSGGQFHSLMADVIRLRDRDNRLTTEGFTGGSFEPFDWKFDFEAERRASWDLAKDGSVDPLRRGRSGLISLGAAGEYGGIEAGGLDKGRTAVRAGRATALMLPGNWIGVLFSLRAYETWLYGQRENAFMRDSSAALGPALRTRNLELDVLGEFRRKGPPGAEMRLTWKNRFLAAGLSAFAVSSRSAAEPGVHMIRDGLPGRASRRFYAEETAGMVLSLRADWMYAYVSLARTAKGKSSLYLHGEGRFEL